MAGIPDTLREIHRLRRLARDFQTEIDRAPYQMKAQKAKAAKLDAKPDVKPDTKPAAKAAPAPINRPTTAKPALGTLEQEMASLLGRSSSGKT